MDALRRARRPAPARARRPLAARPGADAAGGARGARGDRAAARLLRGGSTAVSDDVLEQEVPRSLDLGMTTAERVEEAKAVRAKMIEMGLKPRSLGQILYEQGAIEEEQLEALRREDRKFEGKEQIAGYRLVERLGGGAMGTVYKARQLSL